jgi:hypothetical protein
MTTTSDDADDAASVVFADRLCLESGVPCLRYMFATAASCVTTMFDDAGAGVGLSFHTDSGLHCLIPQLQKGHSSALVDPASDDVVTAVDADDATNPCCC